MMRAALALTLIATSQGITLNQRRTSASSLFNNNPQAMYNWDVNEDVDYGSMMPVTLKEFPVQVATYRDAGYDQEVSASIQQTQTWESGPVNKLCDTYVSHGAKGNFLDIGGNIGAYSMPLAHCLKEHGNGTLVTIEASPENVRHLRAGMKLNKHDNMHLYPYAIGSYQMADAVTLKEDNYNHGGNHVALLQTDGFPGLDMQGMKDKLFPQFAKTKDTVVQGTTLDAIWNHEPVMKQIFAMKMDIEGYELEALKGATGFLSTPPCVIYMETIHLDQAQLNDIMGNAGYVSKGNVDGNTDNTWFEQKDMDACVKRLD